MAKTLTGQVSDCDVFLRDIVKGTASSCVQSVLFAR
jgi:hypothetical protein